MVWTWDPEDEMREHYPKLFGATDFEDGVSFMQGRIVTLEWVCSLFAPVILNIALLVLEVSTKCVP